MRLNNISCITQKNNCYIYFVKAFNAFYDQKKSSGILNYRYCRLEAGFQDTVMVIQDDGFIVWSTVRIKSIVVYFIIFCTFLTLVDNKVASLMQKRKKRNLFNKYRKNHSFTSGVVLLDMS